MLPWRFNGAERLNPRKYHGSSLGSRWNDQLQWGREIEPSEIHLRQRLWCAYNMLQWGREIEPSEMRMGRSNFGKPDRLQWGREIEPSEIRNRHRSGGREGSFNGAERLNPRKFATPAPVVEVTEASMGPRD